MRGAWTILAVVALVLQPGCSDDSSAGDSGGKRDGGADGQLSCPKDYPVNFNGVCIARSPAKVSKRTQCAEIVEDCDTTGQTTPNLACLSGAAPKPPAGPATVTLAGFVDVFSSGPDANNIKIEIFDEAELLKAVDADKQAGKLKTKYFPSLTPLGSDTVKLNWTDQTKLPVDPVRGPARACPEDYKLKLPCIVPPLECGPSKQKCDLKGDEYCHNDKCIARLRWETRFQIKGIPTNKFLVIRSTGVNGFDDGTWGVMAQFDIYLRADAPTCKTGQFNHCINTKGEYELEVNALSKADYTIIPVTAGLASGIPEGNGGIAGEVHDCNDIKLSSFHVGTRPTPTVLAYFNGNPVKTVPDLNQRDGTNIDGLFSALDISPGLVDVTAAGLVGGKVVTAGKLDVAVLPDTVTVVTFEGRKPDK
jgi:hypothetical protein